MRRLVLFAAAAISPFLQAQDVQQLAAPSPTIVAIPPEKTKPPSGIPSEWTVTAECLMVLVSQKAMLELVPAMMDQKTAAAAWDGLLKQVATGEVKLLADLVASGDAGAPLRAESAEDYRFPVDFTAAYVPDRVPPDKVTEVLKALPLVGVAPTSFQLQKLGESVAAQAEVLDGGAAMRIDLTIEHARLLRTIEHAAGRLPSGEKLTIGMPDFHTMRNITVLSLRNGQRVLAGVHRAPLPEDGFELFLFTAKAEKGPANK